MPKAKKPTTYTAMAKRRLRKLLHDKLDILLNGETEEDGVTVSVLDSMVAAAVQGYGFDVHVQSRRMSGPESLVPPGTVEPGPQVGLVR
jgi:hypothetical protein